MSSTFPPDDPYDQSGEQPGRPAQGPPPQPQWQQPGQPPPSQSPQGQPRWQAETGQGWGQGPEYLEQGGGAPLGGPAARGDRGGRRKGLLIGGGVAGLLALGAGAWAVMSFMSQGAQPAEALPASTMGYASIDLDPSGGQKIEALKTLKKFPAVDHELDKAGISNTSADIREKIFDDALDASGCGLKYSDDVEPWIGDRAAVAAIDLGGDQPAVVGVLQITDEKKADEGLSKLQDCGAGNSGDQVGGWAFNGDWVIIAESDSVAQDVVDEAAKGTLADDSDYQKWTHEVGDPGIVNMYAAPEAGTYFASTLEGLAGSMDTSVAGAVDPYQGSPDPFAPDTSSPSALTTGGGLMSQCGNDASSMTQLSDTLKGFKGMAATLRFNDGAVEFEVAGDLGARQDQWLAPDQADNLVSSLPDDTAAAMGVGFQDGWFTSLADQVARACGSDVTASDLMSEWSGQSGLDLPADAETLAGRATAVAIGPGLDPQAFEGDDPSGVPVAVKVEGDPAAIGTVLDKISAQDPTAEKVLGTSKDSDTVVIGPDQGYRDQVLQDGHLGDTDVYRHVIREKSSRALLFVNFDAGGNWLADLAGGDSEMRDNLEPLEGLGVMGWTSDGAAHSLVRLTTR